MYKTMEQIHSEYDGQWVFMVNCKKGEYGSIAGGEVVIHDKDRDIVFHSIDEYDRGDGITYLRYAGRIPEGTSMLL